MKANKKGAPPPGKQHLKTASEIIETLMKRIIEHGGYVQSSRVYNDLVDIFPEVKYNATFRAIQGINKFVDSAVEVYWHTNSIRIYSELEEYVVQLYNKWKKKSFSKFEEIGVGVLFASDSVVKKFEFYDNHTGLSSLPVIDKKLIISRTIDYISGPRHKHGRQQKLDEAACKEFDVYLQTELQKYYHCKSKVGVNVDFSSLFHQIIAIQRKENTILNTAKDQLCQQLNARLRSSFDVLLESKAAACKPQKKQSSCRLSTVEVENLKDEFSSTNVFGSFDEVLHSLIANLPWEHYLPEGIVVCDDNMSRDEFLCSDRLSSLFEEASVHKKGVFLFSDNVTSVFNRCIVVITDHFLKSDLLSSKSDDKEFDSPHCDDDDASKLKAFFEDNLYKDIPAAALKLLVQRALKLIRMANSVSVTGSILGNVAESSVLNYQSMFESLEDKSSQVQVQCIVRNGNKTHFVLVKSTCFMALDLLV
jgi:hypothetical protein